MRHYAVFAIKFDKTIASRLRQTFNPILRVFCEKIKPIVILHLLGLSSTQLMFALQKKLFFTFKVRLKKYNAVYYSTQFIIKP
jgi:hypothetical protein